MFGRNNVDDYDDYKREQTQIKREKDSHKLPKINKKINVSGNPVYFNSQNPESIILGFLVLLFPIFIAIMIVYSAGAELGNVPPEMFVPIGFFFLFFLIFYFAIYGFSPKAKQIELTNNSLVCKMAFRKTIEIPYSDFIELKCKRTYGKNHQYTGTRYIIAYKNPNSQKELKIRFPSNSAIDASDFNFELQNKMWIHDDNSLNGETSHDFNGPVQFLIPQTKNFSATKAHYMLVFPMVAFIMVMFVYGMMTSKSGIDNTDLPFAIMFFVFLAVFVALATLKINKHKWDTTPEKITFEQDGIRINDKYFRSGEIKRLYITPIGSNNPRAFENSTIDIITEDARYSYNLGLFFRERRYLVSRTTIVPEWDFDNFYYSARKWCDANRVEMIDFLI